MSRSNRFETPELRLSHDYGAGPRLWAISSLWDSKVYLCNSKVPEEFVIPEGSRIHLCFSKSKIGGAVKSVVVHDVDLCTGLSQLFDINNVTTGQTIWWWVEIVNRGTSQ